jgi:hypothetical protein
MYNEVNTQTNLPAQIEIYHTEGAEYKFLFIAKGGGSANKTFLYQQTKALLNPDKLLKFVNEKIKASGTRILWVSKTSSQAYCHRNNHFTESVNEISSFTVHLNAHASKLSLFPCVTACQHTILATGSCVVDDCIHVCGLLLIFLAFL